MDGVVPYRLEMQAKAAVSSLIPLFLKKVKENNP